MSKPTKADEIAPTIRPSNKEHRDVKILRLWSGGQSGKEIAEQLGIKASTVAGVVHKHDAARKPRGTKTLATAGLDDAPVEAWQQAMLPHLQQLAEANGFVGADESAFVFLFLLRLKPYENLSEFQSWVHRVTGYARYEIKSYVDRAVKSFLIVGGQPDAAALCEVDTEDETGFVALTLMIHLLQGRFCRTAEGEFRIPESVA